MTDPPDAAPPGNTSAKPGRSASGDVPQSPSTGSTETAGPPQPESPAPRTPAPQDMPGPSAAPKSQARPDRWPPGPHWAFDGTPFTARLADGTPIGTQRARQILLNAGFSTLVLGTDGHPLYLGRRVRCATPAQRRVLLSRYETCAVEGCEIPAIGCQIDHADGWENGQGSDIDQLVMCCSWHNRYKWRHPDRVTIIQQPDGRYRYQIPRPGSHRYGRHGARPAGGPSPGRDP